MRIITDILDAHDVVLRVTEKIAEEKYFEIPKGFNNNIYWNIGHMSATLAILTYKLSGLPMPLEDQFIAAFSKGSSPAALSGQSKIPTISELKTMLKELPIQIRHDAEKKKFSEFKTYTTSAGVVLHTIEDAMQFSYLHDGMHIGYIMAQKRVLGI